MKLILVIVPLHSSVCAFLPYEVQEFIKRKSKSDGVSPLRDPTRGSRPESGPPGIRAAGADLQGAGDGGRRVPSLVLPLFLDYNTVER